MQEVMIRVSPEGDEAIVALQSEVTKLCESAAAIVVASDDDMKTVTDDLLMLGNLKKAVEGKKRDYVSPISDHLQAVRDAFKLILDPLEWANATLRGKVLAYDREQARIRAEQEEINRLKMEAARKEMELSGELSESVNEVEVQDAQPKIYRAEAGKASRRKNLKYEVTDFGLVPDEYKVINGPMITAKLRSGGTIPGIRSWYEDGLRISSK